MCFFLYIWVIWEYRLALSSEGKGKMEDQGCPRAGCPPSSLRFRGQVLSPHSPPKVGAVKHPDPGPKLE